MPFYRYDSFNKGGQKISGTIDASSKESAKSILQGQGLMPVKIEEEGAAGSKFNIMSIFEGKVEIKTKIVFTKQLSVLLKSGVPLLQALELLVEQFDGKFKRVLINIKDNVKAGQTLASQLNKYPKIFSNVYIQLVKAGEISGKLSIILDRLTSYLHTSEETKKRAKKAASYPLFVLGFSFLIIIALISFLVPRITEIFIKMGQKLPAQTLFLKNISDFVLGNYFTLILVFFGFIFFILYWKSTVKGKEKLDEFFLKLPLTSYFVKTKAVVQFSQTLGMLLEAGVNLSEALDIVSNIVENTVLVKKLQQAKDKIIKEGKISKYLKETGIFPNIASYMISTGEQSGQLAQMLLTVGSDYEENLKDITESLLGKIGPITTIVTGFIVGFIVISIFLPMVEMGNLQGM